MIHLLASTCLYLIGNGVGILVAAALLPGFKVDLWSFIAVVLVFTVIVVLANPLLMKISIKKLPALSGGVALLATLAGLLGARFLTSGLIITGLTTWIVAPLAQHRRPSRPRIGLR